MAYNPHNSPPLEVRGCWGCWGDSVSGCRGAALGFSLASSRWTRFSRLKFLNIRPTRAPMLHEMFRNSVDNNSFFNRPTANEKVQKALNTRRSDYKRRYCQHGWTIKFFFQSVDGEQHGSKSILTKGETRNKTKRGKVVGTTVSNEVILTTL